MDRIILISQICSLVQSIRGDQQGARTTQERFATSFPIVSQIYSAVKSIQGDNNAARQIQEEFAHVFDGIPVVGHMKGVVHSCLGQHEDAETAYKAASRSAAVVGAVVAVTVAAPFTGGLSLAVGAGVAVGAGFAADGIITGASSAAHRRFDPYGSISSAANAHHHIHRGESLQAAASIGECILIPVIDAMTGVAVGVAGTVQTIKAAIKPTVTTQSVSTESSLAKQASTSSSQPLLDLPDPAITSSSLSAEMSSTTSIVTEVDISPASVCADYCNVETIAVQDSVTSVQAKAISRMDVNVNLNAKLAEVHYQKIDGIFINKPEYLQLSGTAVDVSSNFLDGTISVGVEQNVLKLTNNSATLSTSHMQSGPIPARNLVLGLTTERNQRA